MLRRQQRVHRSSHQMKGASDSVHDELGGKSREHDSQEPRDDDVSRAPQHPREMSGQQKRHG